MSLHTYKNSQLDSLLSSPRNTLWTYFLGINAYSIILKTGSFKFHITKFQRLHIHTKIKKLFIMVTYENQSCFHSLPIYIL